ncbi:4-alpha-glucanotransferase [Stappia sp. GBMRC 2046]|uniref:4-alpha-glucanotransferase n=1 Tax=Stappia sediminis TaxID=2692190 RepID=A0A7X3LUL7_9HYPH|nr:4-alpha-glucanotransferase [Stappia sediminis]MXN65422.1 4-alpha-glucanotransferase [Stappia sediminis]
MTAPGVLETLSAKAGIFGEFRDLQNVVRPTAPETRRALLAACGLPAGTDTEARETLAALEAEEASQIIRHEIVLSCDRSCEVVVPKGTEWELVLETGERFDAGRSSGRIGLPPLPPGVHDLHLKQAQSAQSVLLIAAPDVLPTLAGRGMERIWGVVGTVYGLRSSRNFGLGDFADLGMMAEALAASDASFYGINPVHAPGWSDRDTISPYSPTHRGFLNIWHIAPDKTADLCACPSMTALVAEAASQFLAVRESERIDYAGHRALLRPLFERSYKAFQAEAPDSVRADLAVFRHEGGAALEDFALFETLSERHGADWNRWPAELHCRESVTRTKKLQARMDFHIWLQWLADRQLSAAQAKACSAGMPVGLYLDLAVGSRLGGAESWCERASLAEEVSIGAPPDDLSPAGQNWNLAAYAPRKLARDRYVALRRLLRRIMRHCGLLRIDHVLGLKRSFWLPRDGSPGGYISQPFRTLAAIVAIEAHRSNTIVVGEDLGLVPDGFRDELCQLGFYGYSVLQYEKADGVLHDPSRLRKRSLACFATHDTPTLRGYWEGADIDWWERLGWIAPAEKSGKRLERDKEAAGLLANAPAGYRNADDAEGFRDAMHATLAQSPAELVAVQLDDILGEREAQNLPSTIGEHPNWLRRCPVPIEELAGFPQLEGLRTIMQKGGRTAERKQVEGSQDVRPDTAERQ